jgi:hypothetical protein
MQDFFQYLVKWSIALGVVYIFYRLVLRPLTFYQWNRRYLVLYSFLTIFIPFINLYTYVPPQQLQDIRLVQYIPAITIKAGTETPAASGIHPLAILAWVLAAGSLVLMVRLAVQWASVRRIRKHAVRIDHPEANVYHVDGRVMPFSFGNAIYLNTSLHTNDELNDIILHEFVHVKQKHSVDIICSEVLCILNWYNPFAWLIRHAIRQNLEFIADQAVLNKGLDRKTYQYHLLKVIGSPQYSIANNFNFSSLKKRIAMMNRLKSARVHLVKFLFVLPLLAVLLVAFRNNNGGWNQYVPADTLKPGQQRFDMIVDRMSDFPTIGLKEFYKRNPSVKEISWSDEERITLYFRDGKKASYAMDKEQDVKEFLKLYGAFPAPLPPPLPPGVPSMVEPPMAPPPPASPSQPGVPAAPKAPALPEGVASVESTDEKVIIRLKNGKTETYHLDVPAEKAALEKKYGEVITIQSSDGVPAGVMVIKDEQESPVSLYADQISVQAGIPTWAVRTKKEHRPVYFLNGKKSDIQSAEVITRKHKISQAEIISDTKLMADIDPQYNAVINFVTPDQAHNKNAYLAKESQRTIEEANETSRVVNMLYVGIDNPINISVEGVPEQDVVVVMSEGGVVEKRNGRYYARVTKTGNVEIRIYKKDGKNLQFLNKRVFRAALMPDAEKKPVTFKSLFGPVKTEPGDGC